MQDESRAPSSAAIRERPAAADRHGGVIVPFLLVAFSALCWSGNHIVGRAVAGEVPPLQLSLMRWLLPMLLLWPFAREHLRRDWSVIRQHLRFIAFLALSGGSIFSALQYVGLQVTYALNVSVLNSVAPVMIATAGALLFRDRLQGTQALGIAVSLAGVLTIVGRGSPSQLSSLELNWGDLVVFLNMAVWGVYSACLRLRPPMHWMSFMLLFTAIAAAGTLPAALAEQVYLGPLKADPTTVLACLYGALFPGLAAMATWNRGVELMGATRAGACLHLIPLYSALLAGLLLGEQLRAFHVAGFDLIVAGVGLAARPAAPAMARPGKP